MFWLHGVEDKKKGKYGVENDMLKIDSRGGEVGIVVPVSIDPYEPVVLGFDIQGGHRRNVMKDADFDLFGASPLPVSVRASGLMPHTEKWPPLGDLGKGQCSLEILPVGQLPTGEIVYEIRKTVLAVVVERDWRVGPVEGMVLSGNNRGLTISHFEVSRLVKDK